MRLRFRIEVRFARGNGGAQKPGVRGERLVYLWATMTVRRNNKDEVVITLPPRMRSETVQILLDYVRYLELAEGSKATEKQANAVADEINASWWRKNRKRILG